MIGSHCLALGRVATHAGKNLALVSPKTNVNINKQIIRLGHFKGVRYRTTPNVSDMKVPTPWLLTCSMVWWWVTWHIITDYHELIGFRFPNPADWTDEELGIPPDDAD